MKLFALSLLLLSFGSFAQRQKVDPISFGTVKMAEDRMPIDVSSFQIKIKGQYDISAKMMKDSVQWVRYDQVLLIPRALIEVSFHSKPDHEYSWEYSHQKIIPMFNPDKNLYTAKVFISLFESMPLELYEKGKLVNVIRILPNTTTESELIDYSCAPYQLQFEGIKNDFVSAGCKIQRTGDFGGETPYLEVLFTSASYRLKDQSEPPYLVAFHKTGEARVVLENFEGKEETITIKATIPERLPRLKLAAGFGPYVLNTRNKSGNKRNQIAPTAMLYGNFALNEASSLRFFDSFSQNISRFHNWGLYFAWDLAKFCDQRCILTSLIGVQGVDFHYDSYDTPVSDVILPQGFEFVYKHPFGNLNYSFSYGMFASLTGAYDYRNLWIRYGKKIFWELNYIEWKREEREASMVGLSIGFPLASFF